MSRVKETVSAVSEKIHKFCEENSVIVELSDVFSRWTGDRGYYPWRGLKYFLFEYEQHLKGKSKSNREKLSWDNFIKKDFGSDYRTIRHIYPQKAKDSYWKERFNDYSVKHRNALRHSLGNLLAVSHPKNSSLSNLPFPVKRDGRNKIPGYRQGSYSEIEVAREDDWTPEKILLRGLKLLNFMESRWKLQLGDIRSKMSLLRLDFMDTPKSDDIE